MTKWIFIAALILTGCATPYFETYRLDGTTIIFTDRATELCGNNAAGCYFPKSDMIICRKDQPAVCGHELIHATIGDFNHDAELEQMPADHTRR